MSNSGGGVKTEGKRSEQTQIIERIFNALDDRNMHNADDIVKLSGLAWRTVINWLDLIIVIQNAPKVRRERVGRINLYQIPFERVRRD